MNITLQLKPEIEAQILSQAAQQGVSLEIYLSSWIERQFTQPIDSHERSKAEWQDTLMEFVNSPSFQDNPLLPDEAINRASIYTREDDL